MFALEMHGAKNEDVPKEYIRHISGCTTVYSTSSVGTFKSYGPDFIEYNRDPKIQCKCRISKIEAFTSST